MSENNGMNENKNNSSEVEKELIETIDDNNDNNESDSHSEKPNVEKVLNESKENKCFVQKVESRYKQSAQEWSHKRKEDLIHNKSKDNSSKTTNTSKTRNPTPNAKIKSSKASTPISSSKSLNCSTVSVITSETDFRNKSDGIECNHNLKKYGKGLTTKRKSVLPKHQIKSESSRVPMSLFPLGSDSQKSKDIEKSINRSIYLRSVLMAMNAKQIQKERNTNAFNKITQIWNLNNELKLKLQSIQNSVKLFENTFESIKILQIQKEVLQNHLELRTLMDPLFSSFADLINKQKMVLKIENCSEKDFEKLNELLKSLPEFKNKESFDKFSEVSKQVNEYKDITKDIQSLKEEFNTYALEFQHLIEKKEELDMTQKAIDNKSLI